MIYQGVVRCFLAGISILPSLTCFGIAGYMAFHNVADWFWFLVGGGLCLSIPERLMKLPDECPTCRKRYETNKPEREPEHSYDYEEVDDRHA